VLLAVNLALRLVRLSSVHVQSTVTFTALETLLVEEKVLNLDTLHRVGSLATSITLSGHYRTRLKYTRTEKAKNTQKKKV